MSDDDDSQDWAVDVAHDVIMWMLKVSHSTQVSTFATKQYSMADVIRESVNRHKSTTNEHSPLSAKLSPAITSQEEKGK